MKQVVLGRSGVHVSRLAIGTGTNGVGRKSDQTRKGKNWLSDLLVAALERGVTFWDLADQYGSHPNAAVALEKVDRSSVQILTKTTSSEYSACKKDIQRFLEELGTNYLDMVLLHGVSSGKWTEERSGAMRALDEAKENGIIKSVGVSCHDFSALQVASEEPWVEILLVRLNYQGDNMDAKPNKVAPVVQKAHDNGKGVVGMKALGCGTLAHSPEKAIQFVFGLGSVDAVTIGPTDDSHLSRNIQIIDGLEEPQIRRAV